MDIVVMPEVLREKLGEQGARELVNLLNSSVKNLKENIGETAADRLERRLAETKAELQVGIAEAKTEISKTKAELIKWMFIFWVGQIAVVYGLLRGFVR
ncbi:MAG: LA_3696 family protein [Moorellales bacterium]